MKLTDRLTKLLPFKSKSKSKSRTKSKTAAAKRRKSSKSRKKSGAAGVPVVWWRRWLWYANPKRFQDFWFTKQGGMAALRIAGVAAGVLILVIIGLFLYFAKDLPSPGQINARALEQTTRFYDRTGEHVLYEVYGDQNRTYIDLEEMGPYVADATVAIEDRNFYSQGAFSSFGIIRAAIYNVLNLDNSSLQGGSTITQQYVKNALLSHEQTVSRKIKELILSIQIEQLYDKNDILELYLNEIGYGAQAYGVQAASQMYFSKEAKDLTLDEAAMLAALPQAPTYYSPYGQNVEDLQERMDIVLDLMAEQGYITQEEADEAKETDTLAKVNETPDAFRDIKAPHFVLRAQEQLEEEYGSQTVLQGGLDVITTIDMDLQKKAEAAVQENINHVEAGGGNNAALVASNPNNGQVMAMVGSRDFGHPGFGAYNAATARRQPGSSFKPYVYAQSFEEHNKGAGSIMYDVRTDFGNYAPNNFDNSFRGNMTVRSALAESRNIPAVKMLYIVGLQNTLDKVEELGITTLGPASNYGLSLVLGSGEVQLNQHVNGYEAFANGGVHYEQTTILKVTDPEGNVLQEWEKEDGERVFDEQVAYLISDILSDDSARAPTFGVNSPNLSVPGHTVAVKTGTTDDLKDGWMMGYSRSLVAGVWAGHNDNEPMSVATSNMTGPIFTQFMSTALEGKENQPFERPDGVKNVTLDQYTGDLASDNSEATVTDLFPAWYEPTASGDIDSATVNTASNRRVNENCMPHDDYIEEITNYGMTAEIPESDPAFPRWNPPVQELADRLDISAGGEIPEKKDNCNQEPSINDDFEFADNGDEIEITVTVSGQTDEVSLSHKGDGDLGSPNKSGNKYTFTHEPSSEGDHQYEALAINNGLYATATDTCKDCGDGGVLGDDSGGSGFPPGNPLNAMIIRPLILLRLF